jgi:hypothetical protein
MLEKAQALTPGEPGDSMSLLLSDPRFQMMPDVNAL